MVYILLGDGFEEIEALTQIDYLRRAGIEIISVGIGKKEICGGHNIKVIADIEVQQAQNNFEMIILPGGLGGVKSILENDKAIQLIKSAYEQNKKIAAICAAPSILASLGILENKKAVCYPGFESCLCEGKATPVMENSVVTDGNITTAKAAGASEEFSFELIKILKGKEKATEVKNSIFAR